LMRTVQSQRGAPGPVLSEVRLKIAILLTTLVLVLGVVAPGLWFFLSHYVDAVVRNDPLIGAG